MNLEILTITPVNSKLLYQFLTRQPSSYRKDFHPFQNESVNALHLVLTQNPKDHFRAVVFNGTWIAFYMLRGWQQGYSRPSFGVLVDYQYANNGLGKLCLEAALTECRLMAVEEIMLKVAPDNIHAVRLYSKVGFKFLSKCNVTGHNILLRRLK